MRSDQSCHTRHNNKSRKSAVPGRRPRQPAFGLCRTQLSKIDRLKPCSNKGLAGERQSQQSAQRHISNHKKLPTVGGAIPTTHRQRWAWGPSPGHGGGAACMPRTDCPIGRQEKKVTEPRWTRPAKSPTQQKKGEKPHKEINVFA